VLTLRGIGRSLTWILVTVGIFWAEPKAQAAPGMLPLLVDSDTTQKDSLKFPIKDRNPVTLEKPKQFDLEDPENIRTVVEYDPESNTYIERTYVGDNPIGIGRELTFQEYMDKLGKEEEKKYFEERAKAQNFVRGTGIVPKLYLSPPIFDKIFGSGLIDIRPSGSAELTFGGNFNTVRNPAFSPRQQKNGQFDFGLKMQLSITGQIGDKLRLNWNYDTEATFEFENQMKLNWQGQEDDILKNIELGNVSLPLNGSLIQGGTSLFGIKTQMQFGKLTVTSIATQQRGETKETEVNGGAQITEFDIQAHEYDANRHYFLAHFFKEQYDQALANLPVVNSGVLINYIEVWVKNQGRNFSNTRDITAYMDLGETEPDNMVNPAFDDPSGDDFPSNGANTLYEIIENNNLQECADAISGWKNIPEGSGMKVGTDFDCLGNARQLSASEFTINDRLGYISLNQALNNDEILAVAFEYTYNGRRYQVGELTRDNVPAPNTRGKPLVVKMLKPAGVKTKLPTWELMMKNIYSLGAYNLQTQDFRLNVVYADDPSGADLNYLPVDPKETQIHEKQLIEVLNLDEVNRVLEPRSDGIFDIIEGVTINTSTGKIIFPVREPFGDYLRDQFQDPDGERADYYSFDALYDSTKWLAEQDVKHNKFFLRGSYTGSSSNEIRLQCFNITEGSVKVTANGSPLTEGTDYIVDEVMGTVKIINEGVLNSGASIRATCESNSLINLQQKSLIGTRLDYQHSENLLIGGTIMHLTERPLTPKVNIGEEPLLNTIWGADVTYNTESRWLTRLVDRLPFIETKEKSTFSFVGEFAHLIPHEPKTMGQRGTSYIDDFEGAETPFDLTFDRSWRMAAVPQGQPNLFPEVARGDSFYNSRRARLSWYKIDQIMQSQQRLTPEHLDATDRSDHFTRSVPVSEVFPTKELQQGTPQQIPTLDLVFRPNERGPYTFNTEDINADGQFIEPNQTWAGITRKIDQNDFEAANIDYIEIWVMDPFVYDKYNGVNNNDGFLYINLGSISEDVLPDGRKAFENGLPIDQDPAKVDTTKHGIVPVGQTINNAFDTDPNSRPIQDVGLDGMPDEVEREFRKAYLDELRLKFGENSVAYQSALADPSADNFVHYRDESYDNAQAEILERYRLFNGHEGSSSLNQFPDGALKSKDQQPNDEDINADYTLNLTEEYYQYKIEISQEGLQIGKNYVTDAITVEAEQEDQGVKPNEVTWYQLKIPVKQFEKRIGGIQDFRSIRFMRMYLKGFEEQVVLRFANLQMVRADWRRYLNSLKFPPTVGAPVDPNEETTFSISTVNVEENSKRDPIRYAVPPNFTRELDPTQPGAVQQNEQSIALNVCNLKKGDARGVFRTFDIDVRNYKTIKMFVHAEGEGLENGDMRAFMRIGTDLESNYYQYEVPLTITPEGAVDEAVIWPSTNEINVALEEFYKVKLDRQNSGSDPNGFYTKTLPNGHVIKVIGLPDLSNVRTIMLGISNPPESTKDEICGEVWFNELRLTEFSNRGGWATTGRMVAKMADFATINVSGTYQSIGFGAIDKRLNDRNLNELISYDISSNFELGKFFAKKSGITIPMYIGWNENIINPKFYPLNPDILLKTAVDNAETREEKDAIKRAAQDYTSRYSLNFTNVRKNRTGGSKPHVWDIENFNASYAYQNIYRRNQVIQENIVKTHRASLGYNFTTRPEYWQPFRKIIKNRKLALIRDFNISPLPTSLNARFDIDRKYSELQNRNNDNFQTLIDRLYDKTFFFNRVYGFNWNLTRSLKVDYTSNVNAWIEEPQGRIDTDGDRDSIWESLLNLGRMNNFNQNVNVNYSLPFRKIKLLNWMTVTAKYSAGYGWATAPPSSTSLGNSIQNSQTITLNGNLNFQALYNKVPALRKLNTNSRSRVARAPSKKSDEEEEEEEEKKDLALIKGLGRALLMLKQAQLTVTQTNGISLPGFTKDVDYFGMNFRSGEPGWPFILGAQDPNIRYRLAQEGYLSSDPLINTRFTDLSSMEISGRATVEPIKGFRISLNFSRRESFTVNSNFRFDPELNDFRDFGFQEFGTFTMTYGSWRTAFDNLEEQTYNSDAFDQFLNNRFQVAQILQQEEFSSGPNQRFESNIGVIDSITNYPLGFTSGHQDVLLHSFLAAYSGTNITGTNKLNMFPKIPFPTWRINYNGLTRVGKIGDYFSNISISHSYVSTLNMNSFVTSQAFVLEEDSLEHGENIETKYIFQQGISIIERLTPLLGLDFTLKNGTSFRFEYKQDRNLTLSAINRQLIETRNKEWVLGIGYRTSNLRLPIKFQGRRILLENDLNIRFDFSIRDGVTVRRDIDFETNTATAGTRALTISPTIDYMINEKINLRMFYNRNVNTPKTSLSYPTALTNFGISLRYTLQ
jgi:cell surface protein SprA